MYIRYALTYCAPLLLALSSCTINVHAPLFGNDSPVLGEMYLDERGDDKILVIPIDGTISSSDSRSLLGGSPNSVDILKRQLNKARTDSNLRAVILKINSPGGGVVATDMMYQEIERFKRDTHTPIIAYFQDTAASGGYYLAMTSDHIVAQRSNVCGSIGVFTVHVSVEDMMKKLGIEVQVIRTGSMKATGLPFKPLDGDALQDKQEMIAEAYQNFVDIVDHGRPALDRNQILKLADGRVYTASKALEKGLIDQIGSFHDAIRQAERLSGSNDSSVITYTHSIDDVERTIYTQSYEQGELAMVGDFVSQLGLNRSGINMYYLWSPE